MSSNGVRGRSPFFDKRPAARRPLIGMFKLINLLELGMLNSHSWPGALPICICELCICFTSRWRRSMLSFECTSGRFSITSVPCCSRNAMILVVFISPPSMWRRRMGLPVRFCTHLIQYRMVSPQHLTVIRFHVVNVSYMLETTEAAGHADYGICC